MATYTELKNLIKAKAVTSFADFFLFISKNQFMEDTGISRRRLDALMASPGHMSMDELMKISRLIGVEVADIGVIVAGDFLRASQ